MRQTGPPAPHEPATRPKRVVVNDLMQRGYRYSLTQPAGRSFDPPFRPPQCQALLHWAYDARKV